MLSNSYPTGALPQASTNTVKHNVLYKENTRRTEPNMNRGNTVLSNTFPNGALPQTSTKAILSEKQNTGNTARTRQHSTL